MAQKWWVLASVACGTFMATLDSSVVNIALPTLTKELNAELYQVKWVIIVYLLVITCLVLPFGRLSDLKGRKRTLQLGYLVFLLGSFLCSLAHSIVGLILFRSIQGVGASMLMANGPAVITAAFCSQDRGAALGTLAMVVSAGLIAGPSIGGLLITHFGWESIFWLNIPVGLMGTYLVKKFVENDEPGKSALPFDWVGTFLQCLLLIILIVIFDPPGVSILGFSLDLFSRMILGVVAIILTTIFIKVESTVVSPLFDLSLLKIKPFLTANFAGLLTFVSYSAVSVLMPFYLEECLRLEPKSAGLFMTAIPLTVFAIAPISGRLSDRFGSQELSILGTFIGALGLFLMSGVVGSGITESSSFLSVLLGLGSIGLGLGLFQSPNNNTIMGSVHVSKVGVASAFLATTRNLGLVIGTGLSTSLFAWKFSVTSHFLDALHTTLFVSGCVALLAMIICFGKKQQ